MSNDNIRVLLSWSEIDIAVEIGKQRNKQCIREGRNPGAGKGQDDTWTGNIEGACGEMAVAKHLNIYWNGAVGDFDAADVGPYQVRTNLSRRLDDMAIRPHDFDKNPETKPFVSVLSFLPTFIICGWLRLGDVKRVGRWGEGTPGRPPCWWVAHRLLHPMSTLPLDEMVEADDRDFYQRHARCV